jgi:hypothetical protein
MFGRGGRGVVGCGIRRGADSYLPPTGWSPRLLVLDEQVGGADLARLGALSDQAAAVVLGHVELQLLRVGAGGGFPARVLLGRVEVVGQVLALAVAHFPVRGKARVGVLRTLSAVEQKGQTAWSSYIGHVCDGEVL